MPQGAGQEEGEEIVLPKNYKRPPPLGGQVPEQDLNPLDDQLEITGMPDKSHSLAPPRGGNQNTKANMERRRDQLMQ